MYEKINLLEKIREEKETMSLLLKNLRKEKEAIIYLKNRDLLSQEQKEFLYELGILDEEGEK